MLQAANDPITSASCPAIELVDALPRQRLLAIAGHFVELARKRFDQRAFASDNELALLTAMVCIYRARPRPGRPAWRPSSALAVSSRHDQRPDIIAAIAAVGMETIDLRRAAYTPVRRAAPVEPPPGGSFFQWKRALKAEREQRIRERQREAAG